MKKFFQKPRTKKILYWLGGIIVFLLIMDNLVLPWYVSSPEVKVPKVVGLKEDDAVRILKDADLVLLLVTPHMMRVFLRDVLLYKSQWREMLLKTEGEYIYIY